MLKIFSKDVPALYGVSCDSHPVNGTFTLTLPSISCYTILFSESPHEKHFSTYKLSLFFYDLLRN